MKKVIGQYNSIYTEPVTKYRGRPLIQNKYGAIMKLKLRSAII